MTYQTGNVRWLVGESLRIGAIILLAFLVAMLVDAMISAFALELFYGFEDELIAVIRYTGLATAILYAVARASGDS